MLYDSIIKQLLNVKRAIKERFGDDGSNQHGGRKYSSGPCGFDRIQYEIGRIAEAIRHTAIGSGGSGGGGSGVSSVNTRTGAVTLDKSDVGLGNVDNTSDADKPVASETQSGYLTNTNQSVGGKKTFSVTPEIPNQKGQILDPSQTKTAAQAQVPRTLLYTNNLPTGINILGEFDFPLSTSGYMSCTEGMTLVVPGDLIRFQKADGTRALCKCTSVASNYIAHFVNITDETAVKIEMPFTAYNNSDMPSNKWARLAGVTIDVDLGRYWNSYIMTFDFSMITVGMNSDKDGASKTFTVLGKATCRITGTVIDPKFQLDYWTSEGGAEPDTLNVYCGLRTSAFGGGKWAWDVWIHNRKESSVDANTTFIKINNIQVIGTEITDYSQIQIDYFSQQTADQAGSPQSDYDLFSLLHNP